LPLFEHELDDSASADAARKMARCGVAGGGDCIRTGGFIMQNYTITEYMSDQQTRGRSYSKYQRMLLYVSLVLFATGLVTLYFGFIVFTVLALGIGVIFHQGSSQYMQLKDQMTEHHYLAMLIATQQSELVALRSEVQRGIHEKDHP